MSKKKTVYRVKGLVRKDQLHEITNVIPHFVMKKFSFETTHHDKREEKLIKKGKKPSKTYGQYAYLSITGKDCDQMYEVWKAIRHFFVKDFTHADCEFGKV